MKTDIITLSYGNEELTKRCIKSLRQHTSNYRLIWVDNGSGTASIDSVMQEAALVPEMVPVWLSSNLGFVKGTNAGLKLIYEVFNTDADLVVLLNNDVEVTDGWLDRMGACFENDHKLMAVGPVTSECMSWQSYTNIKNILPGFQAPIGFESMDIEQRTASLSDFYGTMTAKCRMLAFFCTVFRADVFRKLGYLDERFGIGLGDDDDYSKRMIDAKMKIGVNFGTYVFHNHGATFKKMFSDKQVMKMRKDGLATFKAIHGEEAKVSGANTNG